MKELNGSELAGFIKERQAKQVRGLRQAHGVIPKLAIVRTVSDSVVDLYVGLKQRYGDDIQVEVEVHDVTQADAHKLLEDLNNREDVHGVIVQLPTETEEGLSDLLNSIEPTKDVDGLGEKATFDAATPTAILWLLAGYNVGLEGKSVAVVGQGRLVGAPLSAMLRTSGVEPETYIEGDDLSGLRGTDVIVSAAGKPALITADMIRPDAVIVDAGTTAEGNSVKGDVADDVYDLENVRLTPRKGGVGPLTVCALFDNVLKSASRASSSQK